MSSADHDKPLLALQLTGGRSHRALPQPHSQARKTELLPPTPLLDGLLAMAEKTLRDLGKLVFPRTPHSHLAVHSACRSSCSPLQPLTPCLWASVSSACNTPPSSLYQFTPQETSAQVRLSPGSLPDAPLSESEVPLGLPKCPHLQYSTYPVLTATAWGPR